MDVSDDGSALMYVDRHLVHEVTSPQAFEGLRTAGRGVRRPGSTLATADHNVPTSDRSGYKDVSSFIQEVESRTQARGSRGPRRGGRQRRSPSGLAPRQVLALEENVREFGVAYFGLGDRRQARAQSTRAPSPPPPVP